jgi:hypothetical protein
MKCKVAFAPRPTRRLMLRAYGSRKHMPSIRAPSLRPDQYSTVLNGETSGSVTIAIYWPVQM